MLSLFVLLSALPTLILSISPIHIKGNKFFDDAGREFQFKGLAYQPRERQIIIDPISNARRDTWSKDLELMKDLGINVIRVYEVSVRLKRQRGYSDIGGSRRKSH